MIRRYHNYDADRKSQNINIFVLLMIFAISQYEFQIFLFDKYFVS